MIKNLSIMYIAKQKKETNIVEYVLYIWYVEDMLRGFGFDITKVNANIVDKFEIDKFQKDKISNWYSGLLEMMKDERIEKSGHFQFIKNNVDELKTLHFQLLSSPAEIDYTTKANATMPLLAEFAKITKLDIANPIEVAITALYSQWMLRLKKQNISEEVSKITTQISSLLAVLSTKYHANLSETETANNMY